MKTRTAEVQRKTEETDISVTLNLDGKGDSSINTGIGFLNHMLELLAKHGLFDLTTTAKGDLDVDIHHTNEDVGICLGESFKKALGSKEGIGRYGSAFVPMDEALAKVRIVLDVSGRGALHIGFAKEDIFQGPYTLSDAREFLEGFARAAGITVHIDILKGDEPHHTLEALFKALGRALDAATRIDPRVKGVPSTKGKL